MILLVDTNLLLDHQFDQLKIHRDAEILTSSVAAQELLGMQRPGREFGYRYALPRVPASRSGFAGAVHAPMTDSRPVSRTADRFLIPPTRLGAGSHEVGHATLAHAHELGLDDLFAACAARGLAQGSLKPTLRKWRFLRRNVGCIVPLDENIVQRALHLFDRFVDSGQRIKGTVRNTRNDLLIAATASLTGAQLLTRDQQLTEFWELIGWGVIHAGDVRVVTPGPQVNVEPPAETRANYPPKYVNSSPWRRISR